MSDDNDDARPLDPDRLDGVAHPRETRRVFGHDAAERAFLAAWIAGRPHHAWLLRGPPGVGKASFAYRVARFVLTQTPADDAGLFGAPPPPTSLNVEEAHPDVPVVDAGAHPRFIELRRPWNEKTKTFRPSILVDEVRRLIEFFQLSSADGGWRVAVIDPADDLNISAANALLKLIEEPPARALFLIVAHAPGRLPATIRSRCRALEFRPLVAEDAVSAMLAAADDLDAAAAERLESIAPGAPGQALRLHVIGGLQAYDSVLALFSDLPTLDRRKINDLLRQVSRRDGPEKFEAVSRLLRVTCERLARAGARGSPPPGAGAAEAALFARLAPGPAAARIWAETALEAADRLDAAIGLNLDPQRAILDTAVYIEQRARQIAGGAAPPR